LYDWNYELNKDISNNNRRIMWHEDTKYPMMTTLTGGANEREYSSIVPGGCGGPTIPLLPRASKAMRNGTMNGVDATT
jgi:hypothetical protein